jgi:hypothetical protein
MEFLDDESCTEQLGFQRSEEDGSWRWIEGRVVAVACNSEHSRCAKVRLLPNPFQLFPSAHDLYRYFSFRLGCHSESEFYLSAY